MKQGFGRFYIFFAVSISIASCKSNIVEVSERLDHGTFTIPASISLKPFSDHQTSSQSGMIYVPGGQLNLKDVKSGELAEVFVVDFLMDSTEVTVGDFRDFVKQTGFKTDAENFGNAAVFDMGNRNWGLVDGANWMHPKGNSSPLANDNDPVTQISWYDATAYCKWKGKRLPNEIEWEHAARNGKNDQSIYSWGDEWITNDQINGNVWQGEFPVVFKNIDGYESVAPVGSFRSSPLGFKDLSGNVWEWCDNWRFEYGQLISASFETATEKAMRGGSFLCAPNYCHGYNIASRSFTTPETSLFHLGCRCAKDIKQ